MLEPIERCDFIDVQDDRGLPMARFSVFKKEQPEEFLMMMSMIRNEDTGQLVIVTSIIRDRATNERP